MSYLARFSPFRAIADLRLFLSQRRPYELGFAMLALILTALLLVGFLVDSRVEKAPESKIIYVQNWPLSRTDQEIIAQQKRDMIVIEKQAAERRKAALKRQRQFQRLDDRLKAMGL